MVGLVVAAHGRLAEELVATAEQIVGPLIGVKTVGIEPGSTPEVIRQKMRDAVHDLDSGEGVLVLADLFGGTPCKESLMLVQREHLEVLAGVNLPMQPSICFKGIPRRLRCGRNTSRSRSWRSRLPLIPRRTSPAPRSSSAQRPHARPPRATVPVIPDACLPRKG